MHFANYLVAIAACVFASPMIQVLERRDAAPHPDKWLHSLEHGVSIPSDDLVSLQKRQSGSKTVDIGKKWENKVLFDTTLLTLPPGSHKMTATTLKLTCVECWTKGTLGFNFSAGNFGDDVGVEPEGFFDKIKDEVEEFVDDVEDLFNPVLRIDLANIEVFAHLKMSLSGTLIYQFRLWKYDLLPWIEEDGLLKIGPSVFLDLIFMVGTGLEIESGFHITFPPDAFLEIDIREGSISKQLTEGMVVKQMPVKVTIGDAVLITDLRLTAGVDVNPGADVMAAAPGVGPKGGNTPVALPGAPGVPGAPAPGAPAPGAIAAGAAAAGAAVAAKVGRDESSIEKSFVDKGEFMNTAPEAHNVTSVDISDRSLERRRGFPLLRAIFGTKAPGVTKYGVGIGINVFANIFEWQANFRADIQGETECRLGASHGFNFNVGAAWYAAILMKDRMIGPMPRTSWKLLESKPTSTCLIKNPAKTPLIEAIPTNVNGYVPPQITTQPSTGPVPTGTAPAGSSATGPAPTAAPTTPPGLVAVPYTITTCQATASVANCPDELKGTTVITNYMDPEVASEQPNNNDIRTEVAPATPTEDPGFFDKAKDKIDKAKDKIKDLFGRSVASDNWDVVEWTEQKEPQLMEAPAPAPAETT